MTEQVNIKTDRQKETPNPILVSSLICDRRRIRTGIAMTWILLA